MEITPLDDARGRLAGNLLGRARQRDAIDAALVLLSTDGDVIWTSGANDIARLAGAAALHVDILPV